MIVKLTEDEVRDSSKLILGFDKKEKLRQNILLIFKKYDTF